MNQYIFFAAIAGLALFNIPWSKLGYLRTLAGNLLKSEKGGDLESPWDSDEPPCADTQRWAKAVDQHCPAASSSDKWQYLIDGLSPIQAATKAQQPKEEG